MVNNQNIKIKEQLENLEPELLKKFIKYWSLRKSHSSDSGKLLKQLKATQSNTWLNLIEANHKFRELYGDDLANELIKMIEDESIPLN